GFGNPEGSPYVCSSDFGLRTSHLFDRVPLRLEHRDDAVGADEMRRADHDERVATAAEERLDLGQPVLVPIDEQTLIEQRLLLEIREHEPLDVRHVAGAPRLNELLR